MLGMWELNQHGQLWIPLLTCLCWERFTPNLMGIPRREEADGVFPPRVACALGLGIGMLCFSVKHLEQ